MMSHQACHDPIPTVSVSIRVCFGVIVMHLSISLESSVMMDSALGQWLLHFVLILQPPSLIHTVQMNSSYYALRIIMFSTKKPEARMCPCGGHLNNLIINLMRWLECRGHAGAFEEWKVVFVFILYIFVVMFSIFSHVWGGRQDGRGDWVAASLPPSCGTGNEEKRQREVLQDDVAMGTSQSSECWFLLLEIPHAPHEGQAKRIQMSMVKRLRL